MASKLPPWYPVLLRWLRGQGDSEQDAEDRLHDAWIRMAEFEQNHPVKEPEAFLRTAVRHALIDDRRSLGARVEVIELDEVDVPSDAPAVEQLLIDRDLALQIAKVLLDEGELTCAICLDSMVEEMTYEEIARKRRVSYSTVERRIAKAVFKVSQWRKARKV